MGRGTKSSKSSKLSKKAKKQRRKNREKQKKQQKKKKAGLGTMLAGMGASEFMDSLLGSGDSQGGSEPSEGSESKSVDFVDPSELSTGKSEGELAKDTLLARLREGSLDAKRQKAEAEEAKRLQTEILSEVEGLDSRTKDIISKYGLTSSLISDEKKAQGSTRFPSGNSVPSFYLTKRQLSKSYQDKTGDTNLVTILQMLAANNELLGNISLSLGMLTRLNAAPTKAEVETSNRLIEQITRQINHANSINEDIKHENSNPKNSEVAKTIREEHSKNKTARNSTLKQMGLASALGFSLPLLMELIGGSENEEEDKSTEPTPTSSEPEVSENTFWGAKVLSSNTKVDGVDRKTFNDRGFDRNSFRAAHDYPSDIQRIQVPETIKDPTSYLTPYKPDKENPTGYSPFAGLQNPPGVVPRALMKDIHKTQRGEADAEQTQELVNSYLDDIAWNSLELVKRRRRGRFKFEAGGMLTPWMLPNTFMRPIPPQVQGTPRGESEESDSDPSGAITESDIARKLLMQNARLRALGQKLLTVDKETNTATITENGKEIRVSNPSLSKRVRELIEDITKLRKILTGDKGGVYYNSLAGLEGSPIFDTLSDEDKALLSTSGISEAERALISPGVSEPITDEQKKEYAVKIMDRLISEFGLTPEQAAGFVGNFMRESQLQPGIFNREGSGAVGIAQWLGVRKANLESFTGKPAGSTTIDDEIDFIIHELKTTHRNAINKVKASSNSDEAADNVFGYYEFSAGVDRAIQAMNNSGYSDNGYEAVRRGRNFAKSALEAYYAMKSPESVGTSLPISAQNYSQTHSWIDSVGVRAATRGSNPTYQVSGSGPQAVPQPPRLSSTFKAPLKRDSATTLVAMDNSQAINIDARVYELQETTIYES